MEGQTNQIEKKVKELRDTLVQQEANLSSLRKHKKAISKNIDRIEGMIEAFLYSLRVSNEPQQSKASELQPVSEK